MDGWHNGAAIRSGVKYKQRNEGFEIFGPI